MSVGYEAGRIGEDFVARVLENSGYEILFRNYRVRGGEIDIIARSGDTIAFVEVKTRSQGALVSGEEAITQRKKALIVRTAERFMAVHSELDGKTDGRFDVAAVEINNSRVVGMRYYEGAFDASK